MYTFTRAACVRILSIQTALLIAGAAAFAVPPTLSHSGRLLDGNGAGINAPTSITVKLFDASTNGLQLWTDNFTIEPSDGYFSLELGEAGNEIDASIVGDGPLWVEMTVDTASPMQRQRIQSVPYALVAETIAGNIGTFSPVVHMSPGTCNSSATTVTATAVGHYQRVGDVVTISITDLPKGDTHAYHCIHAIDGLPFSAAHDSAFAIGHARGIQFRWASTIHTNFTLSAHILEGESRIETRTSHTTSPFTGFWYLSGNQTGTFIQSISGTYFTDD